MKNRLFTFLVLIFCVFANKTNACGPFDRAYLARDYFMFRACGENMTGTGTLDTASEDYKRNENCKEWAALTSKNNPCEDILDVVYHWNKSQINALDLASKGELTNYTTGNKFATWIVDHKDTEIADFLLLAKRSETVRLEMGSPWYYAVEGDEPSLELQKIIEESYNYQGKRLKDRYALQAMRALFSCYQYDDCLNYWEKNKSSFKEGVIKNLAQGYVAGSLYHIGEKDDAVKLYIAIGDLYEAHKCSSSKIDFNRWVYEVQPDNEMLIRQLQAAIHSIERWQGDSWKDGAIVYDYGKDEYEKLYPSVRQIIKESRCKNMAPWYYAGAFIADKLNLNREAKEYIELAKNSHPSCDLASSIRVLDLYLSVKYAQVYDQTFENKIFKELRWLDGMIVSNLDKETKTAIVKDGFSNHICGYSQFYWNDMMRRIVISELVPLCIKSNYKTRALQYLNMADNRIFCLVPDVSVSRWTYDDSGYREQPDTLMTVNGYRDFVGHHNCYDYSNDYFINLDSLGVKYVKRLCQRMQNPQCPLDKFLNDRGYNDSMYLYDIIGTQLIAAGKFGEAIEYLDRVDENFNKSRNIYLHCNIDPFTLKKTKPDPSYRLHYAKEMNRIEKEIAISDDPNEKAKLMLKYSRGLINSIGKECWPLTTFYWGYYGPYPYYSIYQRSLIEGTEVKAQEIKNKAFALFSDDEAAAKAYYDWNMYKTAVLKYPKSTTADYIRGHCDELRDYVVQADVFPRKKYELWAMAEVD